MLRGTYVPRRGCVGLRPKVVEMAAYGLRLRLQGRLVRDVDVRNIGRARLLFPPSGVLDTPVNERTDLRVRLVVAVATFARHEAFAEGIVQRSGEKKCGALLHRGAIGRVFTLAGGKYACAGNGAGHE